MPNARTPLYKKLHAIMKQADYIQKDKRNDAQKYNYASEAAIKEKLHGLLVENGVLFIPSSNEIRHEVHTLKGEKSRDVLLTTVIGKATFIDVETGEEVEVGYVGAGSDSNDKGVYKAITGALKYVLTGSFLIPTGDDPENEDGEKGKKVPPANREQRSTTIGQPSTPPPARATEPAAGLAERVKALLKSINADSLDDREREFVEQTRGRLEQYGDRIKVSDKQVNWLKAIASSQAQSEPEYVG